MISKAEYATVLRCAEQYEKELLDTNVLFIYENRRTKKYESDGTTAIKLQILSSVMNIKKTARMIGDYNHSRLHIMAVKMCGSV